MNTLSTQQTHMMAQGVSPEVNVLDALGNQLILDPEAMQLLQEQAAIEGVDFETLLKNSDTTNELAAKLEIPTEELETLLGPKSKVDLKTEVDPKLLKAEPVIPEQNSELKNLLSKNISAKNDVNEVVQKVTTEAAKELNKTAELKENKLLDFNSFLNKQTKNTKERFSGQVSKAYQTEQKSMFDINKAKEISTNTGTAEVKQLKLQDIMFAQSDNNSDTDMEQSFQGSTASQTTKISDAANTAKVFSMDQISNSKSEEIIGKIQDYIIQSKVSGEKSVQMSFDHKELGRIDLQVHKMENNNINIIIGSNSSEASQFFHKSQGDLLASLTTAGIQVGDLKLETSSSGQSLSQDSSSNSGKGGQAKNQEHNSESGQRQEESQKRQELWDLLDHREVA